jgi:hypothetical protein
MFRKIFKKYRIREDFDSKINKTFFYLEKRNLIFGWDLYVVNHRYKFDTLDEAKAALTSKSKVKYYYI